MYMKTGMEIDLTSKFRPVAMFIIVDLQTWTSSGFFQSGRRPFKPYETVDFWAPCNIQDRSTLFKPSKLRLDFHSSAYES
jgi:hypothetical protein